MFIGERCRKTARAHRRLRRRTPEVDQYCSFQQRPRRSPLATFERRDRARNRAGEVASLAEAFGERRSVPSIEAPRGGMKAVRAAAKGVERVGEYPAIAQMHQCPTRGKVIRQGKGIGRQRAWFDEAMAKLVPFIRMADTAHRFCGAFIGEPKWVVVESAGSRRWWMHASSSPRPRGADGHDANGYHVRRRSGAAGVAERRSGSTYWTASASQRSRKLSPVNQWASAELASVAVDLWREASQKAVSARMLARHWRVRVWSVRRGY